MKVSLNFWIARRVVGLASLLVPRWRRRAWREAWDAELHHATRKAPVARRSTGAISHAAWLRAHDWSRDGLLVDLRYALRSLAAQPGFTIAALVVLTVAIGANTTIFELANGLLLRPLGGVEAPERLVGVWRARPDRQPDLWSYPNYLDIRALTPALSGAAAYTSWSLTLRREGVIEPVVAQVVSRDFFEVLDVQMARGGGLSPVSGTPEVVLGHGAWQRRFGGRDLLGETIEVNGLPLQVVGIAAPAFLGLDRTALPEMWLPLDLETALGVRDASSLPERGSSWLRVVGRLAATTSIAEARAAAAVTTEAIKEHAVNRDVSIMLVPHNGLAPQDADEAAQVFGVLMALVATLLLIACANVANLLLARGRTRSHEYGVRMALGASRGRLMRQLLVESFVLSLLAAAGGVVVSQFAGGVLVSMFESVYDASFSVVMSPDIRVLTFAAVVASASVVVFGLGPAVQASRRDAAALIAAGRAGASRRRDWLSHTLVVAQVALSVMVLVVAGLFVRSIQSMRSIDAGFDAEALLHVVPVAMDPSTPAADSAWRERLVERLEAMEEVESLAWTDAAPLSGSVGRRGLSAAPGDSDNLMNLGSSAVSSGYFATTGVALLSGRDFREEDLGGPPRVIIVNEVLAGEIWPEEAAVGQYLYAGTFPLQVVGVTATAKYFALSEPPQPFFYTPLDPASDPRAALLLRSNGPPAILAARLRAEIQALPGSLAARQLATLDDIIATSYGPQRAFARVTGLFAALAFVLAVAGTYGLTSYLVTRRTLEIGIRVALGAGSARVLHGVLRQTLLLGITGVVLGVAAARAAVPAISSMAPGIEPTDLTTFAVVVVSLLASVALAGLVPARRAARIDPLIALRRE